MQLIPPAEVQRLADGWFRSLTFRERYYVMHLSSRLIELVQEGELSAEQFDRFLDEWRKISGIRTKQKRNYGIDQGLGKLVSY
jgi:hypothetical protein